MAYAQCEDRIAWTGKISADIEGYVARSLGTDEQTEVNRATAEEVSAAV